MACPALLDLHVPELSACLKIVLRHPYLLLLDDPSLVEIGLAPVDEHQRIRLPIELGEVELLESGRAIVVMFTRPGSRRLGAAAIAITAVLQVLQPSLHGRNLVGKFGDEVG